VRAKLGARGRVPDSRFLLSKPWHSISFPTTYFHQIWPWHANTCHQGTVGRYLGKFCSGVIARRTYGQFPIYVMVIYGYSRRRLLSPSSLSCRCLVPLDAVVFGISVFQWGKIPPPSPSLTQWRGGEGKGEEGARGAPRARAQARATRIHSFQKPFTFCCDLDGALGMCILRIFTRSPTNSFGGDNSISLLHLPSGHLFWVEYFACSLAKLLSGRGFRPCLMSRVFFTICFFSRCFPTTA